MQIALFTSASGWRGSSVSYGKIGRGLAERGHDVHMVTASAPVTERLRAQGLAVTRIPALNTGLREIAALHGVLRRIDADIVMVDTPRDQRLAAFATLWRDTRIVYRYNLDHHRLRTDLADRWYLSRVAALVFQSNYIRERALGEGPLLRRLRSYHVPNGYDLERFRHDPDAARSFRTELGIADDTHLIVSSAKLTRNKGQDVAIAALARLRQAGMDVLYVICGDGGREAELGAQAEAVKLPTRFLGLVDAKRLVAAMSAADVMVHPSLQEIFPNAVGEAMACGCAVVAADAGGTAELVGRDGLAGILVPPGDPAALAEAIGALLTNPERRRALGAAARARIGAEFQLARMIDGYEAAFRELLGGRP